jgi:heme A synthase
MALSPQQLEQWGRRRARGQKSFRLRFTLVSTLVFTALMPLLGWLQVTDHGWWQVVFMGFFYGTAMYFVSGALWQRNEAEYLKLSNRGA